MLFEKLDSGGSGYLTRTQWVAGVRRWGKSRMADHEAEALFERLDLNNDQRLSIGEVRAFVWDGAEPPGEDSDDEIVDDSPQYTLHAISRLSLLCLCVSVSLCLSVSLSLSLSLSLSRARALSLSVEFTFGGADTATAVTVDAVV